MIHPRIDELLGDEAGGVDSRYALVIVAAKRARQINNYHHQLGEGMGLEEARRRSSSRARRTTSTMSSRKSLRARSSTTTASAETSPSRDASRSSTRRWARRQPALRVRARLVVRPWPASTARSTRRSRNSPGTTCRQRRGGHNGPMARILLGITGGIAAYKACELTRLLVQAGHDAPCRRAAPSASSARRPSSRWRARARRPISTHTSRGPTCSRIAPLTANTMAKLAHGLADDVLTEQGFAHRGPVLVAIGDEHPHVGAPGDAGERRDAPRPRRRADRPGGRRARRGRSRRGADERAGGDRVWPLRCWEKVLFQHKVRSPARVLVSAGGTREPLDSVRFLGNRSSGRMGVAVAAEARAAAPR